MDSVSVGRRRGGGGGRRKERRNPALLTHPGRPSCRTLARLQRAAYLGVVSGQGDCSEHDLSIGRRHDFHGVAEFTVESSSFGSSRCKASKLLMKSFHDVRDGTSLQNVAVRLG